MAELLDFSIDVLQWAAVQSGKTLSELASTISKKKYENIESGQMSQAQAVKFAKLAGIPFGYLFLDVPPQARQNPIADFRTISNPAPLSKDFFAIYDDIDFKQSWYRDMLRSLGVESLQFVGKFTDRAKIVDVAEDMRTTLHVSLSDIFSLRSPDELFTYLSAKAEDAGILIFKNSQVGSNWHRALEVSEFRGFVVSDKLVPAIFINGADAPAAWVFTLAHELAHIWFGDSGISDVDVRTTNQQERLCNAVAAEFLVPTQKFQQVWEEFSGDIDGKLENARKVFKVSSLVIARRAYTLNLISLEKYSDIYAVVKTRAAQPKEPGGDFYRTLAVRNSKRLTNQVARLAATGGISFREAGQLLNTNPNNVMSYYAKITNSLLA